MLIRVVNTNVDKTYYEESAAMKRCTACKHKKPLMLFPRCKASRDGLSTWCRQCHAERKPMLQGIGRL